MPNPFSSFFKTLSEGSENMIAKSAAEKFLEFSKQDTVTAKEVLGVLDAMAFGGLTSDFVMTAVHGLWVMLLEKEGKSLEQGFAERENKLYV